MRVQVLALCTLILGALAVHAGAPKLLSVQGHLTDDQGQAITGTPTSTLSLWDAPTGGVMLHSEVDVLVLDAGRFVTTLGDDGGNPLSETAFDRGLYLEVQIESDPPLTPRLAIRSVPYAMRAVVAESIAPSYPMTMAGHRLTQLGEPIEGDDAATRSYVDSAISSATSGLLIVDDLVSANTIGTTTVFADELVTDPFTSTDAGVLITVPTTISGPLSVGGPLEVSLPIYSDTGTVTIQGMVDLLASPTVAIGGDLLATSVIALPVTSGGDGALFFGADPSSLHLTPTSFTVDAVSNFLKWVNFSKPIDVVGGVVSASGTVPVSCNLEISNGWNLRATGQVRTNQVEALPGFEGGDDILRLSAGFTPVATFAQTTGWVSPSGALHLGPGTAQTWVGNPQTSDLFLRAGPSVLHVSSSMLTVSPLAEFSSTLRATGPIEVNGGMVSVSGTIHASSDLSIDAGSDIRIEGGDLRVSAGGIIRSTTVLALPLSQGGDGSLLLGDETGVGIRIDDRSVVVSRTATFTAPVAFPGGIQGSISSADDIQLNSGADLQVSGELRTNRVKALGSGQGGNDRIELSIGESAVVTLDTSAITFNPLASGGLILGPTAGQVVVGGTASFPDIFLRSSGNELSLDSTDFTVDAPTRFLGNVELSSGGHLTATAVLALPFSAGGDETLSLGAAQELSISVQGTQLATFTPSETRLGSTGLVALDGFDVQLQSGTSLFRIQNSGHGVFGPLDAYGVHRHHADLELQGGDLRVSNGGDLLLSGGSFLATTSVVATSPGEGGTDDLYLYAPGELQLYGGSLTRFIGPTQFGTGVSHSFEGTAEFNGDVTLDNSGSFFISRATDAFGLVKVWGGSIHYSDAIIAEGNSLHTTSVIGVTSTPYPSGSLALGVGQTTYVTIANDVILLGRDIDANDSVTVTNLTSPTQDADAATKAYVDDACPFLPGDTIIVARGAGDGSECPQKCTGWGYQNESGGLGRCTKQ